MFRAFDMDNDGYVSEEEWVLGMSIFLKGTLEEQARCRFLLMNNRSMLFSEMEDSWCDNQVLVLFKGFSIDFVQNLQY